MLLDRRGDLGTVWGRTLGRSVWSAVIVASLLFPLPELTAQQNQSSEGETLLQRRSGLVVNEVTLDEALRELRRSSGVPLAYSVDALPDLQVTCTCSSLTVQETLDRLLQNSRLTYEETRTQVLIGPASGIPAIVGSVVDAETNWPLPTAEIHVVGSSVATVADGAGRFALNDLSPGPVEITASVIGYESGSVTVSVTEGDPVSATLQLNREPISLEEIVISPGRFGILSEGLATMGSAVTRDDIEAIPQFGDDVFRTLKRMPGVASDDISAKLNVRGSTDRNLLVRIDGLELYEPYHLKDLDGAFGIIDVQALGAIDLVTGGFSAEFGDKRGGVFDMKTRRPPPNGTRTTAGLSLSTASVTQQGSFGDAAQGSWALSVRRGWLDIILDLVDVDDEMSPSYWDALGRVEYLFGENHLVTGEVLFAGDDMAWGTPSNGRIESDWTNAYAWASWRANLTPRLRATTVVSGAKLDRLRQGVATNEEDGVFSPLAGVVTDSAAFTVAGVRQDWSFSLTDDVLLKWGFDAKTGDATYNYRAWAVYYSLTEDSELTTRTDSSRVKTSPSGSEYAGYGAVRLRPTENVMAEIGLRYDHQTHTDDSDIAPRILLRYDASAQTSFKASWGRYFQSQGLHELQAQDGQTQFATSERAEQVALGAEFNLSQGFLARVEAYSRSVDNPLPIPVNLGRSVVPLAELESDRLLLKPSAGRARGIELFLSRNTGTWDWSTSYVLSQAEDKVDGLWVPRTLDQRHTFNVGGAWRPSSNWQFSASWQIRSGWPFTEQILSVLQQDSITGGIDIVRRFGPVNQERLPAYHRLDLRATRSFDIREGRLELFLDVFNAYNRDNLRGYDYYLSRRAGVWSTQREEGALLLPRLPTIGFRWVF